jgi:hypothetical protein
VAEMPERKVAEVTIRQYVRGRKQELGWSTARPVYRRVTSRDRKGRWIGTRHGRS